jgi:aspartyl-tRNA(Asn)/glutamyl-tRNA(Gln) amidotransferase subunit A
MALSWTMDKIGPMARSAEDCGLVLAAIAGHEPCDPSSTTETFRFQPRALAGRKFRLGILPTDYEQNKAPEAKKAFAAALEVFHKLGYQTAGAKLPDFPYEQAAGTLVEVEGSAAFENLVRSSRLEELADRSQQAGLLGGLATTGVDYLPVRVFERCDALIAPTLLQVAPPIEKSLNESWNGMGGNGGPGNLLGWPSLSIPMGFGKDHLPLGLEIIGAPYQEATLLAIGMAFQRETDWHRQLPTGGVGR